MSVLSQILADKRLEVHCARKRVPASDLERRAADAPPPRDFVAALHAAPRPALIAEVKKASPSKGVIREDFDPLEIARIYAANGAACISVLTDEQYFQGHLSHLAAIRQEVDVPLLRKDFILDDYQLLEARAAGADAVLLIAAALTLTELEWLLEGAATLGMAALVEVHDEDELKLALEVDAPIIGVNNRNLHTFRTTLNTTMELLEQIPSGRTIVSESGINTREDVERLREAGVHAILVGEALMRQPNIAGKMHEMQGTSANGCG